MPHLVIEHSENMAARVDLAEVVRIVHAAALETGVFPEKGTRTRTASRAIYRIADADPDNAFVHLVIRIGSGRDLETRRQAGGAIFASLCDALATDQGHNPLAISCELQEIHPELSWKKNNLPEWIETRKRERR